MPCTRHLSPQEIAAEALGQKGLQEVHSPWNPEWMVVFEPGRPGLQAMTYTKEWRTIIWVRETDTPKTIAAVYTHELGHVFSHLYLTTGDLQREWLKVRGLDHLDLYTIWSPSKGEDAFLSPEGDFSSGEGDFAECFQWTFQKFRFKSKLGKKPNKEQQDLIRKWVETLPKKTSE